MQGGVGSSLGLMQCGNALLTPFFEQVIRLLCLGGKGGPGDANSLGGPARGAGAVQQFAHHRPYLLDLLMEHVK